MRLRRVRGRRGLPGGVALSGLLGLLAASPLVAQRTHLLVVSGLGGDPQYSREFHDWGAALADAARRRYGLADSDVTFLAERAGSGAAGRSTLAGVGDAIAGIAKRSSPGDRVLIVLIGHGTESGGEARLNLPGPDLTPGALAGMLDALKGRAVAVVNTSSSSGGFLPALAAPGRIVVTATRSGAERNETVFPGFFVAAYTQDGADTDKDGRVSLLEAFEFAQRRVAESYQRKNLLRTEHAQLDGDGDGTGSGFAVRGGRAAPAARTESGVEDDAGASAVAAADARPAAAFVLGPASRAAAGAPTAAAPADAGPALRALYAKKRTLEASIDSLKTSRATLAPERYQRELEALLVELARTDQAIRKSGGGA